MANKNPKGAGYEFKEKLIEECFVRVGKGFLCTKFADLSITQKGALSLKQMMLYMP